ncbi:MAG: hypothetical protein DWI58_03965 [Chloroflexi bacterium]|nr:MAG: hypothetical protein DWI58_03965 [Chloroflexota bacterium]
MLLGMSRLEPLLEEFLIALVLMTVLAVIVALLFWWVTGQSPWPYVVIAEIGAFGWGTAMLALASPRNRRR